MSFPIDGNISAPSHVVSVILEQIMAKLLLIDGNMALILNPEQKNCGLHSYKFNGLKYGGVSHKSVQL